MCRRPGRASPRPTTSSATNRVQRSQKGFGASRSGSCRQWRLIRGYEARLFTARNLNNVHTRFRGIYLMATTAHTHTPKEGADAHARLAELIRTKQARIGVI